MMRNDTMLKPSDLIVRGLFLAVVIIGGIAGRQRQLDADMSLGLVPAASPTCQTNDPETSAPAATPGTPTRAEAGQRQVLSGSVRSSAGCVPIGGAKIEFWPDGPDAAHDHAQRGTLFADGNGKYRLQCDFPAADRAAYMYLRVSADGYATLMTQYGPKPSQAESEFAIVLQPGKP